MPVSRRRHPSRGVARRRTVLVASVAMLGFALTTALFATWYDRLPDPLATHVGDNGDADGFAARAAFLPVSAALTLGVGAVLTGVTWHIRANAWGQRLTAAMGVGIGVFVTAVFVVILQGNLDVAEAHTVHFGGTGFMVAFGCAAVGGAAGWVLAGPPPDDVPDAGTAPAAEAGYLPAQDSELLVWTRRATSPGLAWTSAVLAAAGVAVGAAAGWWQGAPLLGGTVLTAAFAAVRVTVDATGVTVTYGPLPRPRTHVPLARIAEADTRQVRALREFGGWGYRMRPGASGVILRSGEALEARLAGGGAFVVTVSDARTAADVVNTLAARDRPPADRADTGGQSGDAERGAP